MPIGDLADIRRELMVMNRNLQIIAKELAMLVREQRHQNVMFMKAYRLQYEDVQKEDEESRRKWA
jgi:hypothetical protein